MQRALRKDAALGGSLTAVLWLQRHLQKSLLLGLAESRAASFPVLIASSFLLSQGGQGHLRDCGDEREGACRDWRMKGSDSRGFCESAPNGSWTGTGRNAEHIPSFLSVSKPRPRLACRKEI